MTEAGSRRVTRADRRANRPVKFGHPEFATYAMCVVVKVLDAGLVPAGPLHDELEDLLGELTIASAGSITEGIE